MRMMVLSECFQKERYSGYEKEKATALRNKCSCICCVLWLLHVEGVS